MCQHILIDTVALHPSNIRSHLPSYPLRHDGVVLFFVHTLRDFRANHPQLEQSSSSEALS